MNIIDPTDKITNVVASSENASYPATFVQDNFRTNPWKAGSAVESTLTLTVSANSAGIGLSYMNSATVKVKVEDQVPATLHEETYNIDSDNPNLFLDYGAQSAVLTITLTFSDPGAVAPYCGVIRCSSLHEFNSPKHGFKEGLREYAISNKLNSGALDYTLLQMVRTFSGSFNVDRDSDFYTFMHSIIKAQGRNPMFWFLQDLTNQDWGVFASVDNLPSGSHDDPEQSNITLSLAEVI